jgi:hypothetical protein
LTRGWLPVEGSRLPWLLGLVVFIAGLLVTPGYFHSVDEVAMFVAAHNLIEEGEAHTNQMAFSLWAIRPGEEVVKLNQAGDVYTKKSPLVVIMMVPLLLLGKLLPFAGHVRLVLLLGAVFTTATAVLLYHLARELGYGRRTATAGLFLFAFGTMALPYARTAWGEPVIAFGLLLAGWAAVRSVRDRERPAGAAPSVSLRLAFWSGVGLALAIGSNPVYVLLAPLFALFVCYRPVAAWPQRGRRLLAFTLPLAMVAVGMLLYNAVRFGSGLETGYHFAPGQEGFSTPLWWGILGLTISPARGFLWYNPPVLLALLAWPRFHRAQRPFSLLALLVVMAHLLIFGAWWQWWGGYAWGPRFLLPIVPYLILVALPLIDAAVRGRRLWLAALLLLGALGLLVQVGGTAVDFNLYEQQLDARSPAPAGRPLRYHHHPSLVFDVGRSPILEHWRQLSWATYLQRRQNGREAPDRLLEIPATIRRQQKAGDRVLSLVPELLLDWLEQPDFPPVHGLPYNVSPDDTRAGIVFQRALHDARRVWLVTWYGPGDPGNWYESDLRREWATVSEVWADGLRLVLLARPPQLDHWTPAAAGFGPIRLAAYSRQQQDGTLFVELLWRAESDLDQDYVTFVHLLDPAGNLLAQQDRAPLAGYRPTSTWLPGEGVVDRFAFPIDTIEMNEVQVVVGWYSWPSLERLPVKGKDGEAIADDHFVIGNW